MIVLIDNYDSFTYNLYHLFGREYRDIKVIRNDDIDIDGLKALQPSAIILSPGPGYPQTAGISIDSVSFALENNIPLFGVCLGLQSIGAAFGVDIIHAPKLMHGKTSIIHTNGGKIFKGINQPFKTTRYHSLVLDKNNIPDYLKVTAISDDGVVMAAEHETAPIFGVQFHPESILSECSSTMVKNFLSYVKS